MPGDDPGAAEDLDEDDVPALLEDASAPGSEEGTPPARSRSRPDDHPSLLRGVAHAAFAGRRVTFREMSTAWSNQRTRIGPKFSTAGGVARDHSESM